MGDDRGLTRPARALTLATGLTILGATIALVAAVPSHDRTLLALGAIGGGTVLVAASLTRHGRVSVLSGELALLSFFLLLATAAPHLHDGSVPTSTVDVTLLATLLGFVSGAESLILSRRAASPLPQARWLATTSHGFREGEILIVGTILLAAAATSATGPHVPIPRWNWWSFLGLAAPAMFLIIGARARPRNAARTALTVAGLTVMLYGSAANLGAGSNAFRTIPHLTLASLAVCGLGVALVELSISRGRWQATGGVALGVVLMALSERSLATGASLWSSGRGAGLLAGALLAACALPLIAASVWQGSRPRQHAHTRALIPHDVPASNQHRHEQPPRHQLPAGTNWPLRAGGIGCAMTRCKAFPGGNELQTGPVATLSQQRLPPPTQVAAPTATGCRAAPGRQLGGAGRS